MRSISSAAIGCPHSGWPFGPTKFTPIWARRAPCSGVDGVDTARLPRPPLLAAPVERGTGGPLVELRSRSSTASPSIGREDLEADPRCTLLIHATVREVMLADDAGSVERLDVRTPSGRTIDIRARHYLLAAGGIENPRILLASNSVAASAASAMPTTWSAAISWSIRMPAAAGSSARPTGAGSRPSPSGGSMASKSRRRSRRRRRCSGAKGLLNSALTDRRPPAGRAATIRWPSAPISTSSIAPRRPARGRSMWKATKQLVRGYTGLTGPLHPWLMKRLSGLDLALVIRAEQAPNPDSRVMLDWREGRDRNAARGARLAAVGDRRRQRRRPGRRARPGIATARAWRGRAGRLACRTRTSAGSATNWSAPIRSAASTIWARPAWPADPRRGVTDGWGRVHGLPNLHIAGSSLFPTGGWANPTLTILALALRTADRIAERASCRRRPGIGRTGYGQRHARLRFCPALERAAPHARRSRPGSPPASGPATRRRICWERS